MIQTTKLTPLCFIFFSLHVFGADPLGNDSLIKGGGTTEAQILWQTIKNGVTHVAQLEQLHRMTKSQIETAKRTYNNFKTGKVRSATELLNEMNRIEGLVSYTNNLFRYTVLLDNKIAENILEVKNVVSGEHYRMLVEENKKLKEKQKNIRKEEIKALADNQEQLKKRLDNLRKLSAKNNNSNIKSEERKTSY